MILGVAPQLEIGADANEIHAISLAAMKALSTTMHGIRRAIPDAFRALGVPYPFDFIEEPRTESGEG